MSHLIAQLREERERQQRLTNELSVVVARHEANPDNAGVEERLSNLNRAVMTSRDRLAQLEGDLGRLDHLRDIAGSGSNRESGTHFGAREAERTGPHERRGHAFAEAQRQIEGLLARADLSTRAADHLDKHLRERDPVGVDSQYVAAVSQPAYGRAFAKLLQYGTDGAVLRMSTDERDAFQQVGLAEQQRALAEGTGNLGGFAIPITIDPTMTLVSNGAINPIRQLATVRTISTRELRLLATDGVTATYAPEGAEVADNSPILAQPDLITQRAHSFVPFSYEIGQDWGSMQEQLLGLFADAKDVLEAQKFAFGGGPAANEPSGILSIGVLGGLTTGQQVLTSGPASVSTGDIYTLRESVGFRFMPSMQFLASPAMVDRLYRLVPRASTTDPTLVSDDRQSMLGRPLVEWSSLPTAITTGTQILIAGDIKKGYVIADRIGMSVELVPNLFGANRRPVGMRGLYAFWRNSGTVISSSDNSPLRYLQTS